MKKVVIVISGIALIAALGAGAYFLFPGDSAEKYNFTAAVNGNIAQEVNLTGNVKAAESVKLAFEKSAKIALSNFKVGDKVKTGQLIASLVSSDLSAQLAQARAAYDAQAAILKNLEAGAGSEDIQLSKDQVQSAEKTVADSQMNLSNVQAKADNDLNSLYGKSSDILNDVYSKSFDALYNQTDGLFIDGTASQPMLAISLTNSALKNSLEQSRPAANQELTSIKNEIDSMGTGQPSIDNAMAGALSHAQKIRDYLNNLSNALNYTISSSATPASQILTYKSNINSGLTNINSSIAAIGGQQKAIATQKVTNQNLISSAQTQLNQANNNLLLAQNQLKLKQAGATADQIAAQAAAVRQASAAIQNIQAQLSKSALISPINGTISQQDAKAGEIASMNTPLISIISDVKFQIEIQTPEADIEKIKAGQTAEATLDADSSQRILQAKVILIDPAKTIANGSATYKVTLEFTREDPLIKDGLTANVKIITQQKTNTLLIPASAVIKRYDKEIVLKDNGAGGVIENTIISGISQNGLTEILFGLTQGDKVASFGTK